VVDYLVKPVLAHTLLEALARHAPPASSVLIVDDEAEAQRLYRRVLAASTQRYRVSTASDAETALRILGEESVDVILLDLIMPGMGGFQFLAHKNSNPALRDIPVILMSAHDATRQPAVSQGLALLKPDGLSISQVLGCIQALSRLVWVPFQ